MNTETAIDEDLDAGVGYSVIAEHGPFLLTSIGMRVSAFATDDVPYDVWSDALAWCQSVEKHAQFWVADLLAYGEARYGERYSQAMDATGSSYGTLANAVYVAKAIPLDRRRPDVSFAVHQEVAPLPPVEQDAWLAKAANEGLTRDQLRHAIKVSKAATQGAPLELWLLVKCASLDDQEQLADRLRAEGRGVKLQTRGARDDDSPSA